MALAERHSHGGSDEIHPERESHASVDSKSKLMIAAEFTAAVTADDRYEKIHRREAEEQVPRIAAEHRATQPLIEPHPRRDRGCAFFARWCSSGSHRLPAPDASDEIERYAIEGREEEA